MLTRLKITNFLLIEELELDFKSGLTVVTGETGSGKSIIIDALLLVFGARANTDIVRLGTQQATFEAEFSLSNPEALKWLKENDLIDLDNPESVLCRRVLDRNSKNKIYINGYLVTSSQVKFLGESIIDVHTQHASITLLKSEVQRNLLDEYSGIIVEVKQLGILYKEIIDLEQKIQLATVMQADLELKREILEEKINELNQLDLKANEWQELETQHKELSNADSTLQELDYIQNIIQNQDVSLLDNINRLQSRLIKLSDAYPKIKQLNNLVNSIEIELQELNHEVSTLLNSIEQNPQVLTQVEERMKSIFALSRKYRISPEQILPSLEIWQKELAEITVTTDIEALNNLVMDKKSEYKKIAGQVSKKRLNNAKKLSLKVTELLHELAISGSFVIQIIPVTDFTLHGLENIEYQICFNKGLALQALTKVASGGELSRTALALYLLLSVHNPPEVIIFDEIDVGIGGKIAAIVGKMLADLGKVKQIICITHQPQAASYADNHLVVKKVDRQNLTLTQVNYLNDTDRVTEIARMLSGIDITDATLQHAKEMLTNHKL